MKRRTLLVGLPVAILAPQTTPAAMETAYSTVFLDVSWVSAQREVFRHFYNQPNLVNRAVNLHENFPISALKRCLKEVEFP